MNRRFLPLWLEQAPRTGKPEIGRINSLRQASANCVLAMLFTAAACSAQIITVDTSGKGPVAANGPLDRQYAQIEPTHVELTKTELDAKTRLLLIRTLQSEQGFAMRPFPRGHKGLTLAANGKLEPAGTDYLTWWSVRGYPPSRAPVWSSPTSKSTTQGLSSIWMEGPMPSTAF